MTVIDPLNRVGAGAGTGSGVGATTPGAPSRYTEEDEVHPNLQPRSSAVALDLTAARALLLLRTLSFPLLLQLEPSLQEHTHNHHGDVSLTP